MSSKPDGTEPFAFMLSDEQLGKIRASGVYPILGYAPGRYWGKCATCNEKYTGDKRSVQCFACAVNSLKKAAADLQAENGRLKAVLQEIASGTPFSIRCDASEHMKAIAHHALTDRQD